MLITTKRIHFISKEEILSLGFNGFKTDKIYSVYRERNDSNINANLSIKLCVQELSTPYTKEWPYKESTVDFFNEILDKGYSFALYDHDRLIGLLLLDHIKWNNSLWIENIRLTTEYQGKGHGKMLMAQCIEEALRIGARIIGLETQSTNFPAIEFYKNCGFEISGVDFYRYPQVENDFEQVAIIMNYSLTTKIREKRIKSSFPPLIREHVIGFEINENALGKSDASIYTLTNSNEELYLKIEQKCPEFEREKKMLVWLKNRLPVPQILAQDSDESSDYVLMTKAKGHLSSSALMLSEPEQLISGLADGIKKLWSINIEDCPSDLRIENKLKIALERIERDEVDLTFWEHNTDFDSPMALYKYLHANMPKEDLVFSHGDYCLPNIFIEKGVATGFIDLGRSGIADQWQDIALCVRDLEKKLKTKSYTKLLFQYLNLEPDPEKIKYYILLDELF